MITIRPLWPSPPLRSNDRHHWAVKAKATRTIRRDVRHLCQWQRISPIDGPVTVTLVWTVTDKRRRDVGASSPTLKAALDGIVDAGVLPADHSGVVVAETCRIELGTVPGVRIEIREA